MTIIDAVGNFAEKAAKHGGWRREATLILANSDPMELAAVDAALNRLRADVDDELESLRVVCWNDVLKTVGRSDAVRDESRMERLMRAVA